jgi:mRNA-degrading endonuclease toxin of MazEF toxin-antitoxin module
MKKNFRQWHDQKSKLNENEDRIAFFNEKDVWFISLGANIGFEQDGKGPEFLRPIIIFKKFSSGTFWGIPLTSHKKTGQYYFIFEHDNNRTSTANLSQLRLIDSKRLKYKIGSMLVNDFTELKKRIISIIG